jgi:4-carboxymuconolactone decarboxylase
VREVVIIAVGAVWGAEYELYAQFGVAHKVGLSDDAVAALAKGGIPDELSDHEKIAVRLARDLSIHHRVETRCTARPRKPSAEPACSTSSS